MNRIIAISSALALTTLAGCNGTPEDSGPEPCSLNSVEESFPANGITNAYYRTSIESRLDDADADASISVSDASGEVAGTVSVVEDRVVFTPDADLASSTEYTVTTTYSPDCSVETSFTTSEVGAAISDASTLAGKTYNLDLASGRFVQPEGIGSLLGKYLGDVTIYLNVSTASATEIQILGALGDSDSTADPMPQSVCDPTIDFPVASFTDNPFFEIDGTGSTTSITVSGITVEIDDMVVSGAFAPDGSYIAGGVLAGSIDTRPLVDLVEEGGADDAICELAGSIGVACEECDDGEMLCLSLFVDNLTAPEETVTITAQPDPYDPCVNHASECPDDCAA